MKERERLKKKGGREGGKREKTVKGKGKKGRKEKQKGLR